MKAMTGRERVLMAINHKEADRVPINFGGEHDSGITESIPFGRVYTRLCQHLGFYDRPEPIVSDCLNIVSNIDDRVRKRFHADMKPVGSGMKPAKIEADGSKTWEAFGGVRIRRNGFFDEFFDFPMRNMTKVEDLKNWPYWPDPKDPTITQGKREEARKYHEETDFAILASTWYAVMPFNAYSFLTGYDRWLMDMKLNPKFYFALSDKLMEIGLAGLSAFLQEVGDYVDLVGTFDDLGSQEDILMSPADYRKFVHPYSAEIIKTIKKYTQAKIFRHACGSCYKIIPDFIEMGVDVLHPVQPGIKNHDPKKLKAEFGKDITFCTGIDVQRTLGYKTPKEIKEDVKRLMDIYAPGGGFIVSPTHNIEPETPPENIVAAYEAALEYGKY